MIHLACIFLDCSWTALDEISPTTRHQRSTVHKTANVLDKLAKSVQPAAKSDLREIWMAGEVAP
jgi:putative transposase